MKLTKTILTQLIKEELNNISEIAPDKHDAPIQSISQLKSMMDVCIKVIKRGQLPVGMYDKETGLVLSYSKNGKYVFDLNAIHIFLKQNK